MAHLVDEIMGADEILTPDQVIGGYEKIADWVTIEVPLMSRPVMLVGPMQGALYITADVSRMVKVPIMYRMVKVSLYDAANQAGESANFDFWPISNEDLENFDFIVLDDVAESLRTYAAMRERLVTKGASVKLATLVDKPTEKRIEGWAPDFFVYSAAPDKWLVGAGMNDGDTFEGEACRCVEGVWAKRPT